MLLKRLIIAFMFLTLLFGAIFGYKHLQKSSRKAFKRPPPAVAVEPVLTQKLTPRLRAVGSVVASSGISVTTETAGVVKQILFKSGDRVSAGTVLVKLDDKVDQAELLAKRAAARLAQVQYLRSKELLPKRLVSKSSHDEAKANYDAARAQVEQQEAIIERKIIRAPFTGYVGIREVSVGQYIKPGDVIASLQTLSPIHVDYSVPERYLPKLKTGQQVEVRLDAYKKRVFKGTVKAIEPAVDSSTRTIKVRASLDNQAGLLRPGMFAEVFTVLDESRSALMVPRSAISFNTYGDFLYIVVTGKNGKPVVRQRQVVTGEMKGGRIEIRKGITAADKVVVSGYLKLRNGMPVRINKAVTLEHSRITSQ